MREREEKCGKAKLELYILTGFKLGILDLDSYSQTEIERVNLDK